MGALENMTAAVEGREDGWMERVVGLIEKECFDKYNKTLKVTRSSDTIIGIGGGIITNIGGIEIGRDMCHVALVYNKTTENIISEITEFLKLVDYIFHNPCGFVPPPNANILIPDMDQGDVYQTVVNYIMAKAKEAGTWTSNDYICSFETGYQGILSFVSIDKRQMHICFLMHSKTNQNDLAHFAQIALAYFDSISVPDNDVKPLY